MKEEIIENIFKQAQQNFARPISKEEIIKIIDETENKLGFELSGYAKQDKPYRQFFDEKTQRTIEKVNEIEIIPATDLLYLDQEIGLVITKIKDSFEEQYQKMDD